MKGCSAPAGTFYPCSSPNVTLFTQLLETPAEAMGAFAVILGILQYVGLYIQLNAALNAGHGEVDNHISGNGKLLFCLCLWVDAVRRTSVIISYKTTIQE